MIYPNIVVKCSVVCFEHPSVLVLELLKGGDLMFALLKIKEYCLYSFCCYYLGRNRKSDLWKLTTFSINIFFNLFALCAIYLATPMLQRQRYFMSIGCTHSGKSHFDHMKVLCWLSKHIDDDCVKGLSCKN